MHIRALESIVLFPAEQVIDSLGRREPESVWSCSSWRGTSSPECDLVSPQRSKACWRSWCDSWGCPRTKWPQGWAWSRFRSRSFVEQKSKKVGKVVKGQIMSTTVDHISPYSEQTIKLIFKHGDYRVSPLDPPYFQLILQTPVHIRASNGAITRATWVVVH